jgi:hypothetical protein
VTDKVFNWDSSFPAIPLLFTQIGLARPALATSAGIDPNVTGWQTVSETVFDAIVDGKGRAKKTPGGLLWVRLISFPFLFSNARTRVEPGREADLRRLNDLYCSTRATRTLRPLTQLSTPPCFSVDTLLLRRAPTRRRLTSCVHPSLSRFLLFNPSSLLTLPLSRSLRLTRKISSTTLSERTL